MGIFVQALVFYNFIILARVLMSWVPGLSQNPIGEVIYQVTEPVLAPIRQVLQQLLPPSMGMLDLSPIVVYFLIRMLIGVIGR